MNTETDEIEIDLVDLLKNISKRWKQILIITLAGIVIAVPFALSKQQETLESLKASLDPDRAEYVEDVYSDYTAAQENENKIVQYLEDSAIMKVDAYEAPRAVGTYVISSDIVNAWKLYEQLLQDEKFCNQVADILGLTDSAYASEMVCFSAYSNPNDNLSEQGLTNVMTVTAYGYSSDEAQQMQQLVSNALEAKTDALNSYGINVTVKKVDWTYAENYDSNIFNKQQEIITDKNNALQTIIDYQNDVIAKLSTEEATYFNALDGKIDTPVAQPKKVVIGGFVGLFLAFFYYALRYVMVGVIHTEDDAKTLFVTASYGVIHKKTLEHDIAMIAAQINTQIRSMQAKTLFIQTDGNNKDIINEIINKLTNITIKIGNITDDPESFQAFVSSDLAIATATIRKTKTKEVDKINSLTSIAKKKISGIIVMEEL